MHSCLSAASCPEPTSITARLASARLTDEQARQVIASPEAHRAFIAALCAGLPRAAGKRV